MKGRVLIAALVALGVSAADAGAQSILRDGRHWSDQLRITPTIGWLIGYNRAETWTDSGTDPIRLHSNYEIADGGAVGLNVEIPLGGRIGLTALGAFGSRGETDLSVLETGEVYHLDGSNIILGRLGLAVSLYEPTTDLVVRRLGAAIWAGGAVMHERVRNSLNTAEFVGNATHFGINFGISGDVPFGGERFALQLGVEDNFMWWSTSPTLAAEIMGRQGAAETLQVAADPSHVWLARVGISIRMR